MDLKKFIEEQTLIDFPVGLGGCRTTENFFDSCEYDLTVFDNKSETNQIIPYGDSFVNLHHGTLDETKSKLLVQYDQMQILRDESWDLRMFLARIKEKRLNYFKDYAKNCLIDSIFCCEKCKEGIINSDVFASCWQKCASYFLSDAICLLNIHRPSPSHMLDRMRKFEKSQINEQILVVNETIGIERATPSLLERMLKSTIGFSDVIEQNDHSKIIQKKHDFFVTNSMLSDCYFYLGYINKENFMKIKDSLNKRQDLIHILKIAFDIQVDSTLLSQQAERTQKTCREILVSLSSA